MNSLLKLALGAVVCVVIAGGVVVGLMYSLDEVGPRRPVVPAPTVAPPPDATAEAAEPKRGDSPFIDPSLFEDGGLGVAATFSGAIHDPRSLDDLRKAIEARGTVSVSTVQAELAGAESAPGDRKTRAAYLAKLHRTLGQLHMYNGKFELATKDMEAARTLGAEGGMPDRLRDDLTAVLGILALRRGEVANCIECVGPSSCIFPIAREAMHTVPAGSREAVARFTEYLDRAPGDLRVRWLLNLANMTLGEYPQGVPKRYLIPLDRFASSGDIGRFENVATVAGLTARGPNQAGGSVFDDLNGDGWPDLFLTSLDADRGPSVLINRGDGTFEDRSSASGTGDQIYALNVTRADIDNDGDLDLLLLRGAWEKPMRMSLLRNKGDATFEDITIAAGLAEPIASESAAWGDFDNDGFLDVFVSGESLPPLGDLNGRPPDPRNRCRLYRNRGNGTFEDVAASAGVADELCSKGSAWGDYDGDGKLDLYVSNMVGACRLYHNEGSGKFVDVAPKLGVTGADRSFAVWFWDYDNDGKLDIFVNDYAISLAETAALAMGRPLDRESRPRLYRNLGPRGSATSPST